MSRKSYAVLSRENLVEVSRLIKNTVEKDTRIYKEIAIACNIAQSHFSYVVNAKNGLSKKKLIVLTPELNIDSNELLRAVGYIISNPWLKEISLCEVYEVASQ